MIYKRRKIKDGEKVVIDMSDRDSLNFTLSDENNYKMQIKSDTRKSNEVVFDYEEHQTVEFECVSDYIEGPLSCLLNKVMKKDGIKLEKTKDFLLY